MTASTTDEPVESQLNIERAVPAKYVLDPRLLSNELERLFGEGKFAVEVSTTLRGHISDHGLIFMHTQMRHNCYQIKASKEFKLVSCQLSDKLIRYKKLTTQADLVKSCPSLRRIPSNASGRLSFKQIGVH